MTKLLLFALLTHVVQGARVSSTTLTVTIRPAAAMRRVSDETVSVRIRLAPQTQGLLWRDQVCGVPLANSYVIGRSGEYSVPAAAIPGDGGMICLRSSDGAINKTLAGGGGANFSLRGLSSPPKLKSSCKLKLAPR